MEAPLDLTLLTIDRISVYDLTQSNEWLKIILEAGIENNDPSAFRYLINLRKLNDKNAIEKIEVDLKLREHIVKYKEEQVGLLLGLINPDADPVLQPINYTHIFVKKEYRNRGICTEVLRRLSKTHCELQVSDRMMKLIVKNHIMFFPHLVIPKNKDGTVRFFSWALWMWVKNT